MADLFISYSRRNKAFVQELHAAFGDENRDVWVDWEDIPPSTEWWKEIERGIEAANAFIFVISPASVQSKICYREVEHAVQNNKRIIPLLYEDVGGPLMDQMHEAVGNHNWIFFNDPAKFQESFGVLSETLDTDFEYVREHTRLQVRAREWERGGREEGSLLRGEQLMLAEQWLATAGTKEPAPSPIQTEFIITSQQFRTRSQRTRLAFVSGALVITLVLAILSAYLGNEAQLNAEEADRNANAFATSESVAVQRLQDLQSREFAQDSEAALEGNDTQLAILLALEAVGFDPPGAEALLALANAAYAPGARDRYAADTSVLSLAANDDIVVYGDLQGTITVRDLATDAVINSFQGDDFGISALDMVHPTLVGGTDDGELIVWDVQTGTEIRRWTAHTDANGLGLPILEIDFDGTLIASISEETQAKLSSVEGGVLIDYSTRYLPGEAINALALSPDSSLLALGGDSLIIFPTQLTGGNVPFASFSVFGGGDIFHTAAISALAFHPDGDQLVTGSLDAQLKVWDLQSDDGGNEIRLRRTLDAHTEAVTVIKFGSEGFTFASASETSENAIILWNAATFSERARLLDHNSTIEDLEFFNDGLRLLSVSLDGSTYLWDAENGALVRRFTDQNDDVAAVAFNADGTLAAAGSDDASVLVWDIASGQVLQQLSGHTSDVLALTFAPDGTTLATGGDDRTIILWDATTGAELQRLEGHSNRVQALDFSPDGSVLASASRDRTIRVWTLADGNSTVLEGHSNLVNDVQFSPDGTRLLSGAKDRSVIVWDAAALAAINTYTDLGRGQVTSVAFAPDGQTALVGDSERMFLMNVDTGDIIRLYRGHRSTVTDVAFSADGRLALSASADADVVLWDVDSGEERLRLEGHRASVNSVAFDPGGTRALSASSDDTVVLWRIDSVDELIEWLFINRIVEREYTCPEREAFNLPLCDDDASFPTRTPFFVADSAP